MSLNLCPECGDRYDEKITARYVDEPADATLCHHDVQFEGEARAGVWYLHGADTLAGVDENVDREGSE